VKTGPDIHSSYFIIFSNNIELLLQRGWKVSEINTYGTMDPYLLYWMSGTKKGITWDKNNFGNLECYNLYQKNGGKAGLPSGVM
jgi:hypothetical protein